MRLSKRGSAGWVYLIEVLVTLAVLGFALVLIVSYKPTRSNELGLRGAAAELAAGLRLARSEAILRNRSVTFDLELGSHRFRVGEGSMRQLPSWFEIGLLTIGGTIRFSGRT